MPNSDVHTPKKKAPITSNCAQASGLEPELEMPADAGDLASMTPLVPRPKAHGANQAGEQWGELGRPSHVPHKPAAPKFPKPPNFQEGSDLRKLV